MKKTITQILIVPLIIIPIAIFADDSTTTPATTTPAQTETSSTTPAIDETAISSSTTPVLTASTTESVSATSSLETSSTSTPATTTEAFASSTASSTGPLSAEATTSDQTVSASGTPEIISGDSVAMANILNLVNTNFINSNGVILFSNFFDFLKNNLDLRNGSGSLFDGICSNSGCTGDNASINFLNNAFIENSLFLHSASGNNSINGGATSTIDTGDAYAGLNLINIANTNVVDSEYLLVTLNAFKGLNGDIVFPSLDNFFNTLGQSNGSIQITNQAQVTNNADVNSASGGNNIDGNGSIATGDAQSSSNIFNQLNTNLVGGANVSILFRVYGNWVGEVFGAPDNLKWGQSPDGSLYLFNVGTTTASTTSGSPAITNINGSNDALINNNISVVALTGNNNITGAGTGLISTGNAFSGANIVNIANSNIIGRNWIMAIINIFGDWHGNIAFGRPDLWVGEQIEAPKDINQGAVLTYKFSIINNGDSKATNVKLVDKNDLSNLKLLNSTVPYTTDDQGRLVWDIGTLPAGKATEISYQVKVSSDVDAEISNIVSVISKETDNNDSDNTDTASVRISKKAVARTGSHRRSSSGSSGSRSGQVLGAFTSNSVLSIQRSDPLTILKDKTRSIHQKLVIRNPNPVPSKFVTLRDVIKDPRGKTIHTEFWNFGDIMPREEITVTYDLTFKDTAENGFYSLSSTLNATGTPAFNTGINGLILLGNFTKTAKVQAKIDKTEPATKVSNVEVQRESEQVLEFVIPVSTTTTPAANASTTNKKIPIRYFPVAVGFSLFPMMFTKIFQVVKEII